MKTLSIEAMMAKLEKAGVRVSGTSEDFYGHKVENNGIWIAADHMTEFFDYYSTTLMDTFGVNKKLNDMVEEAGWYFEWYDAGTIMLHQNF